MITTDLTSLKLHIEDDIVWYLDGDDLPRSAGMVPGEFLLSDVLRKAESVRVMGTAENAALILALTAQREAGYLESVEVVTPLVCETAAERNNPAMALYRMRQFMRAPSLGGYHQVTSADVAAYSLVVSMQHEGWTPATQKILMTHPAWRPLNFIPELDWHRCATLLAKIVDPRWYVDVYNPDRGAKLEAYLGLDPKTQAGVSIRKARKTRRHKICNTVLGCWKLPHLYDAVVDRFELAGPRPFANSNEPGLRPGDFPWRIWGYVSGIGPGSRQPGRGCMLADLRASQRFVAFLRLVWLQELYTEAVFPSLSAPLFRADSFFSLYVEEAEAFNHYICYAP
jgi:hypothetical protein